MVATFIPIIFTSVSDMDAALDGYASALESVEAMTASAGPQTNRDGAGIAYCGSSVIHGPGLAVDVPITSWGMVNDQQFIEVWGLADLPQVTVGRPNVRSFFRGASGRG